MSFIEGFVIGFSMIIFIGPVFFLLLNSTLQYGVKVGTSVALGIIVSDIVCVLLCYFGFSSFLTVAEHQVWVAAIGSSILLGLGVNYLFKKATISNNVSISSKSILSFFVRGFSVNFFNPYVILVWIGVLNYGHHKFASNHSFVTYIIAVLIAIFITDMAKVLLSNKLQRFISAKRLSVFLKITGVVLILFSIRLLFFVW